PNLVPERALTQEFGLVFQPVELPGFGASIDYWDIDIKGEIASVSVSYVLAQCYAGVQAYCADIARNPDGTLYSISTKPLNFAEAWAKGVDYELSYQKGLASIVSSWK